VEVHFEDSESQEGNHTGAPVGPEDWVRMKRPPEYHCSGAISQISRRR
jgi:hypothetical protein